jgi:UDP-N-acetylmuramate dehydrogenase
LGLTGELVIERGAQVPTWFGIGGRADRLARPADVDGVRRCLEIDPGARVLGDGANLLVDDEGVGELVIATTAPEMRRFWREEDGRWVAMAGAPLAKLVTETVRLGYAGLEGLGGIPASVGGAVVMNAGGSFGEVGPAVSRVYAVDRGGQGVVLERGQIPFSYRHSGLGEGGPGHGGRGLVIARVELDLKPGDPVALRQRLKAAMEHKKRSQPMAEKSAGCCFKNPTLERGVDGIGEAGERVSAGMLIDRAGCKGLRVGGAEVSPRHANFLVTGPGARARDVIELMRMVRERVMERFGVEIEPEVVVWRRG